MRGDVAKVFLIVAMMINVVGVIRSLTFDNDYWNGNAEDAAINAEIAREMKAQLEETFLSYEQIDYVSARVNVEGRQVTHVSIVFDGPSWKQYLNSLLSELKRMAPSARLWVFDTDANFVYQE